MTSELIEKIREKIPARELTINLYTEDGSVSVQWWQLDEKEVRQRKCGVFADSLEEALQSVLEHE